MGAHTAVLEQHKRPSLLLEARTAIDLGRMLVPLVGAQLRREPDRGACPIVVAPGFGSGDRTTRPLRHYLNRRGYRAEGWGLGKNLAGLDIAHEFSDISPRWQLSFRPSYRGEGSVALLCDRLIERLERRHQELGERLTLIGWSLGGYLVREAARDLPDIVDRVVTLGSPVVGGPKYTAAAPYFRRRGLNLEWIASEIEKREARAIQQPITAIYSKSDAIVSWPAAIDRYSARVRHIEVNATHLGMGFNPTVWAHIVEALEA